MRLAFVVEDTNKQKLKRNTAKNKGMGKRVWKLKDKHVESNFEQIVGNLIHIEASNL